MKENALDEFQPLHDTIARIAQENPHWTARERTDALCGLVREDESLRRLLAKWVQANVESEIAEEQRRLEKKQPGLFKAMAATRDRTRDLMASGPILPFMPRG